MSCVSKHLVSQKSLACIRCNKTLRNIQEDGDQFTYDATPNSFYASPPVEVNISGIVYSGYLRVSNIEHRYGTPKGILNVSIDINKITKVDSVETKLVITEVVKEEVHRLMKEANGKMQVIQTTPTVKNCLTCAHRVFNPNHPKATEDKDWEKQICALQGYTCSSCRQAATPPCDKEMSGWQPRVDPSIPTVPPPPPLPVDPNEIERTKQAAYEASSRWSEFTDHLILITIVIVFLIGTNYDKIKSFFTGSENATSSIQIEKSSAVRREDQPTITTDVYRGPRSGIVERSDVATPLPKVPVWSCPTHSRSPQLVYHLRTPQEAPGHYCHLPEGVYCRIHGKSGRRPRYEQGTKTINGINYYVLPARRKPGGANSRDVLEVRAGTPSAVAEATELFDGRRQEDQFGGCGSQISYR